MVIFTLLKDRPNSGTGSILDCIVDIGYTYHDHPLVDLDIYLTYAEQVMRSIVMHGCANYVRISMDV